MRGSCVRCHRSSVPNGEFVAIIHQRFGSRHRARVRSWPGSIQALARPARADQAETMATWSPLGTPTKLANQEAPVTHRPINFSAGPAILPQPVLEEASAAVSALPDLGLSILEISHRSPTFAAIIDDARARLTRLLAIPDTHDLLFLQGGARGQFAQIPTNFLGRDQQAGYVMTGVWSEYALTEAQRIGTARVVASGREDGYTSLPRLDTLDPSELAYIHTTSNNTIYGTQFQRLPDFGHTRHVCDMSSDILSRPVDVSRFSLIYAGAQKNCGPAGVTLVIVDKAWMREAPEGVPAIWRYQTQATKGSMYNTPPTFAIYVVGLVAKWIEEQVGGLAAMAERNRGKAQLVYDAIDNSKGFYVPNVGDPSHRSLMNVGFRTSGGDECDARFVSLAAEEGLSGLKGHRLSGGLRASIYNAMPRDGVETLVGFMERFRKT